MPSALLRNSLTVAELRQIVAFYIKLQEFEPYAVTKLEYWEMSTDEKLEAATVLRERGNGFFKVPPQLVTRHLLSASVGGR